MTASSGTRWSRAAAFLPAAAHAAGTVRHPQPLLSQLVEDGRVWWESAGQILTLEFSPDGQRLAWLAEVDHGYGHAGYLDGVEVARHSRHPRDDDDWWWYPPWDPRAAR